MAIKISKINIHAFRGIPDLDLGLEDKSLLLRGENGSGKSSIIDAIEFFFTGKIKCLESIKGLSPRDHGTHVNFNPKDLKVAITFNPGGVSLERSFDSFSAIPSLLENYFQVTNSGTFVLRRIALLVFISSQPAERYRAIGNIIGIDKLDTIELEMKRLRDDLKDKTGSAKTQIEILFRDISEILGRTVDDKDKIIDTLNERIKISGLPPIDSLEQANKHAEEMLKSIKKNKHVDKIKTINELMDLVKPSYSSNDILTWLRDLNEKVKPILCDKIDNKIWNLLKLGIDIIDNEEMNSCPLCESKIDHAELSLRVQQRLQILEGISQKNSEVKKSSLVLVETLKKVDGEIKSVISLLNMLDEFSGYIEEIIKIGSFLEGKIFNVSSAINFQNDIQADEIYQALDTFDKIKCTISAQCYKLLSTTELTDEEKKVLELYGLIEQIYSKSNDIDKYQHDLNFNRPRYEIAEKIYSSFSKAKKIKTQEIYSLIQEDIQKFYQTIHPDEPHKNIELIVSLGKRASTEIKMESFGRSGEDPRALTSEGHLDSLGLCIFLAFVKKFNHDCSLIVLDDVVTTVDNRHREHICKLLLEEFGDKQLIITTHEGVWYEQLRAAQRAYKMDGTFKNLLIVSWDVDAGPSIRPYISRWEKIEERIRTSDIGCAGNEGRQYLEWVLEKICGLVGAPVTFKGTDARYEIRDLLDPAKKRLNQLIDDEAFKARIDEAFLDLDRTIILGNILSHNNILTGDISIDEVERFCKAVHNLHQLFLCPACGTIVNYYSNLKIVRCSSPRCSNPIIIKTK